MIDTSNHESRSQRAAAMPGSDAGQGDLSLFLSRIASDPELEGEWLELLSQLEYVGCRKILKSVPHTQVSLSVLHHVAEEASHAFLLKAAAKRIRGSEHPWAEGRFGQVGWQYFQALDQAVSECVGTEVGHPQYPAVSWAIERRVLAVYPEYLETTRDPEVKRVLRRILAQEERHGREFAEVPFPEAMRARILDAEAPLWARFRQGLEALLPRVPAIDTLSSPETPSCGSSPNA